MLITYYAVFGPYIFCYEFETGIFDGDEACVGRLTTTLWMENRTVQYQSGSSIFTLQNHKAHTT